MYKLKSHPPFEEILSLFQNSDNFFIQDVIHHQVIRFSDCGFKSNFNQNFLELKMWTLNLLSITNLLKLMSNSLFRFFGFEFRSARNECLNNMFISYLRINSSTIPCNWTKIFAQISRTWHADWALEIPTLFDLLQLAISSWS